MDLPQSVTEIRTPVLTKIIETLHQQGIRQIEEVDLDNNFDAKLITEYLIATQELLNSTMRIYVGISETNDQEIYIFIHEDDSFQVIHKSEFDEILMDLKTENIDAIISGEDFQIELEKKKLRLKLKPLPISPSNIKSVSIATDIPQVAFLNAFKVFHAFKRRSPKIGYTIKFTETGEYVFYEHINRLPQQVPSRSISEVFPEVTEVELNGKARFPSTTLEEERAALAAEAQKLIEQ